jgi:hypothetical protein
MMCFLYDSSLITAFLDRWRLETHSFRLPVGEMTVSLEDVAMLFSLPLGVVAMVAIDVPNTSVHERSSERSRASTLLAIRGRAWTHHDLVAVVQHTCFYLIFFIFCMYLKQM